MVEWRWVDEQGRAMTHWKAGSPPPMSEVSDSKGTMRVETRGHNEVTHVPCPCGSAYCRDRHLVGIGKFVQGSGFTVEEAERICAALNKENGDG